jgi:hypothetical protein
MQFGNAIELFWILREKLQPTILKKKNESELQQKIGII